MHCPQERWFVLRREVTLHARANVVGFYERLGYSAQGDPFLEVGIPHRHMRRAL